MRKTPFTFLAKAQRQHTSRTGECIVYTQNKTPLPAQAVTVQSGDFLNRDAKEFVSHMSFLNVVLLKKPTSTDTISYNDDIWHIDEWRPAGTFITAIDNEDGVPVEVELTMYDLSCVIKRTNPTDRGQYERRGGR